MPFTGQLGTPNSYLGNIELGLSPSAFILAIITDSFVVGELKQVKIVNVRITPGHLNPRVVPPVTPHHSLAILVNKPPTPPALVANPGPVLPTPLRSLQAAYAAKYMKR